MRVTIALVIALALILSVAAAGCGEDDGAQRDDPKAMSGTVPPSPTPSAPRYSETDRETIAFLRSKRRVIDEALQACDTFVTDAGVAFDAEDLVAFKAARKPWKKAYDDLEEAVRASLTVPRGEDARVRAAVQVWRRYTLEVGGLYRAVGTATGTYLEHGADSSSFDRDWIALEEQRDKAYAASLACDELVGGIWDPQ
jgi:hypothetical protein